MINTEGLIPVSPKSRREPLKSKNSATDMVPSNVLTNTSPNLPPRLIFINTFICMKKISICISIILTVFLLWGYHSRSIPPPAAFQCWGFEDVINKSLNGAQKKKKREKKSFQRFSTIFPAILWQDFYK